MARDLRDPSRTGYFWVKIVISFREGSGSGPRCVQIPCLCPREFTGQNSSGTGLVGWCPRGHAGLGSLGYQPIALSAGPCCFRASPPHLIYIKYSRCSMFFCAWWWQMPKVYRSSKPRASTVWVHCWELIFSSSVYRRLSSTHYKPNCRSLPLGTHRQRINSLYGDKTCLAHSFS